MSKDRTAYNLKDFHNVFFIGIGGVSMSGLAETLHFRGFNVSGSDHKRSDLTERLCASGITVYIGHQASNMCENVDLVVYTAAIRPDNPEWAEAKKRGVAMMDRAMLMGLLMREYACPICVSGTHGKTTTTSMIAGVFLEAGKDPSINLGGVLPRIGSNYRVGADEYFIAESCEYFDSFLQFYPFAAVITNIEPDHLDYFKDMPQIEQSFRRFAKNIHEDGFLVVHSGINCLPALTDGLRCAVLTYGLSEGDWTTDGLQFSEDGFPSFDVLFKGKPILRLNLIVPGAHNALNALAAVAVCHRLGIEPAAIAAGLQSFGGTKRRYEVKGVVNGITLVDDYAHHPTEIKATLASAKNTRHKRTFVAFQPHTFTRTKHLLKELSESFDDADCVVLVDIYAAREKDTGEVHSRQLAELLVKRGVNAVYASSFEEAEKYFFKKCIQGDLLITMGAGDVNLIGEAMLRTGLYPLSTG